MRTRPKAFARGSMLLPSPAEALSTRASVARATARAAAGSPRRPRFGGRLREEVDGDVDAVGVVGAGCRAAGARVGAGAAHDGHVVGVTLRRELPVGQRDRARALLVLATTVERGADEARAPESLRPGPVEDAVRGDRLVTGRRRAVAGAPRRQV